jgi:hypothetical protein
MSDFLSNLIARNCAVPPAIRPRLPSRFESTAAGNFTEVQSFAPETATAKTSPEISPAPKLLTPDQTASAKQIANAATNSAARKQSIHTNETTPIPMSHSDDARESGFNAKTTVVPITATPGEKKQGDTEKTQQFQPSSARPAFQARRQNLFSPDEPRSTVPIINVTIGRVEVRAIQSAAPAPKPAKSAPPKLSLDDYLQKRDGGAR